LDDIVVIETQWTLPGLRRSMFGMQRWLPTIRLGLIAVAFWIVICAINVADHRPIPSIVWALIPIVLVGFALTAWQILAESRRLVARAGTAGPVRFTATPAALRSDVGGDTVEVAWPSIQRLCVSRHTIYAFLHRNHAWYIPHDESAGRLLALARSQGVRIQGRGAA
jgi:hypothetical protein